MQSIERVIDPYAFDKSGLGYGFRKFIRWNDLLNVEKGFVKNDSITMEFEIEAEDPSDANKSRLTFEKVETSCGDNCIVFVSAKDHQN